MGRPKPLVKVGGRTMLARTLDTLREAGVSRVVTVLGDRADEIRAEIDLGDAVVVENPRFREGMSTSLRLGAQAVGPTATHVVTVLGDQPFVAPGTIRALLHRAETDPGLIFIPTYKGVRGNPVVFDARLVPELGRLTGDVGCRGLFPQHAGEIREVAVDDPGVLIDIDTDTELAAIERALEGREPTPALLDLLSAPRWTLHQTPAEHPVPKRLGRAPDVDAIAQELRGQGVPFALATVVRAVRPTSGRPGYKAIVREDGSHVGWVGGACTEHILVAEARRALAEGSPRVLRVTPTPSPEGTAEDGVVERPMVCASGGTVEVFIEPNVPKPNLVVVGDTPVATSLAVLAPVLGFRVVLVAPGADRADLPEADLVVDHLEDLASRLSPDTYVIVASMGKYDEGALALIARAEVAFVGLVASRKRSASIFAVLREEGVASEAIGRIQAPVGLEIAARTPEEIALSVLAEVVRVRRTSKPRAPEPGPTGVTAGVAVDPVCQMEVEVPGPISAVHAGTTYYFCAESCRRRFVRSPMRFLGSG